MAFIQTMTVLVVDDVQENVDILLEILDDLCEVAVALDGESALDLIRNAPPNLILLDIMMPGMDGYEVCRRLKSDPLTREIPIIFITALDSSEDESRGLSLGAIDYITKPFNPTVVRARVKNHLALCEAAILQQDVDRIMRHDLKNPLGFIITAPELLLMTETLSDDGKVLIKQLEESGRRLLNMINLSLDLFKMERHCYEVQPVDVELTALIRKIVTEHRQLIEVKSLHCTFAVEKSPDIFMDGVIVAGEELLCYTLFSNLIKNALEAAPNGTTVTISLKHASSKGHSQKTTIHNMGTVPETIRERFFMKYATADKKGGTGLGTYSAALIAQTLGGALDMETSNETGTTLTVFLPPGMIP